MSRRSRSSRWRSSSTSEGGRTPAALPVALIVALAAAVAGCSAFDVFKPSPAAAPAAAVAAAPAKPEPKKHVDFDHRFHLSKGPTCADCHEDTDKSDKAAMPKLEFCMDCHTDIDEKKAAGKTVASFLDKPGGKPEWSHVTAQSPDIVFSHKTHLAKKLECNQCHKGIEESTGVTKELFVDMDACTKCHKEMKAKTDCATCHRQSAQRVAEGKGPYWPPANHVKTWQSEHGAVARLAKPSSRAEQCDLCHGKDTAGAAASCTSCHTTTKPADHEKLWTTLHGQTVRADPDKARSRCGFCHDSPAFPSQSKCLGCHATQPPRDHTQSWRVDAGHGLSAAMDRVRCEACHTTDSCIACHTSMEPRNHRGGWGPPRDTHCANCHLPLTLDEPGGCGVCHKSTPGHNAAPRMPSQPPHRPDLQCRQCHNAPPHLKHFDNGTACLVCHH